MSAWIRTRQRATGKTYQVCYRRGGRGYRVETAGTFGTQRDAKTRRDLVAGWLAAGKDPRAELEQLLTVPPPRRTYRQAAEQYVASRVDHSASSARAARSHLGRLLPIFGHLYPEAITVDECIAAVAELSIALSPSSLGRYWVTHRLILQHAGVDPNPARDRRVKMPQAVVEEIAPPPFDHVLAILDGTPPKRRLPFIVIERTGMRVGEVCSLRWGDVDVAGRQFRLRRGAVKTRAGARWVQVPDWLMALIAGTCPPEDRSEGRPVFMGLSEDTARAVMGRACRAAGVPHYTPHDLRHRRLSLWHAQGVTARELAARAGHSKASMSLDVYSHVLLDPREVPDERMQELLTRC